MKLKITEITIEKIINNELVSELPELYKLKECIENNSWHNNDSVFSHSINVAKKLEKLLSNASNKTKLYLNFELDNYRKRDLLLFLAIFHDIGKLDTLVETNNSTMCPGHEKVGAENIKNILKRINISKKEEDIITNIIRFHGEIHGIVNSKNSFIENELRAFSVRHRNIFLELVLLGAADILGSQLIDNNEKEYYFRMKYLMNVIK